MKPDANKIQLPPRLELRPTCPLCKGIGKKTVIGFNNKPVLHTCSLCKGTGKLYLPVDELTELYEKLEAENESLKAQLKERNNRGTGFLYVPKAQYDALKAERDKMLEVVREYRRIHESCSKRKPLRQGSHPYDFRCPTCIKADALLSRDTKKEK